MFGEFLHFLMKYHPGLFVLKLLVGRGLRSFGTVLEGVVANGVMTTVTLRPSHSLGHADIVENPVEPGTEPRVTPERVKAPVGPQKGVLHQLFGFPLFTDDAHRKCHRPILVTVHKLAKSTCFPLANCLNYVAVSVNQCGAFYGSIFYDCRPGGKVAEPVSIVFQAESETFSRDLQSYMIAGTLISSGGNTMDITGMLAIIFFFTTTSIVLGSFIFTRHRERMNMIEKGMKPEDMRALYAGGARQWHPLSSLKWGIVFVSVGLAILVGMVLRAHYMDVEGGVFPALIALFGGIGLVVFYLISKKYPAA
jgi:hypothetical protein